MVNKRKMPDFSRWTSKSRDAIKPAWRKPRGINSKIRKKLGGKMKMPSISYGAQHEMRYLHPSGLKDVLVYNLRDLEKIDSKKEAARIAASVGKRKRSDIMKKAEEMKLKILNPVKSE